MKALLKQDIAWWPEDDQDLLEDPGMLIHTRPLSPAQVWLFIKSVILSWLREACEIRWAGCASQLSLSLAGDPGPSS